jgi:hypothetical protein
MVSGTDGRAPDWTNRNDALTTLRPAIDATVEPWHDEDGDLKKSRLTR